MGAEDAMRNKFLIIVGVLLVSGCAVNTAPLATIPARQLETDKITVAGAQRLQVGMSGADVIAALGSPNIVTGNSNAGETWVYDKFSREVELVSVGNGSWLLSPRSQSSSVSSSSERTLTVVVEFGADKKIERVSYRQSSF